MKRKVTQKKERTPREKVLRTFMAIVFVVATLSVVPIIAMATGAIELPGTQETEVIDEQAAETKTNSAEATLNTTDEGKTDAAAAITDETPQVITDLIKAVDELDKAMQADPYDEATVADLAEKADKAYKAVEEAKLLEYAGLDETLKKYKSLSEILKGEAVVEGTPAVVETTDPVVEAPETISQIPQSVTDFINAVAELDGIMATRPYDTNKAYGVGERAAAAYNAVCDAGLEDYEGVPQAFAKLLLLSSTITGDIQATAYTPAEIVTSAWCTNTNLYVGKKITNDNVDVRSEGGVDPQTLLSASDKTIVKTNATTKSSTQYVFSHFQVLSSGFVNKNVQKAERVTALRYLNGKWQYKTATTNFKDVPNGELRIFYNEVMDVMKDGDYEATVNAKDWAWSEKEWTKNWQPLSGTTYGTIKRDYSGKTEGDIKLPSVIIYQFYDANGKPIGVQRPYYYSGNFYQTVSIASLAEGYEPEVTYVPLGRAPVIKQAYGLTSPTDYSGVADMPEKASDKSATRVDSAALKANHNLLEIFYGYPTREFKYSSIYPQACFVAIKLNEVKYPVVYKSGYGDNEVLQSGEYKAGSTTPKFKPDGSGVETEPVLSGYRFTGWVKVDGNAKTPRVMGYVEAPLTFEATWTPINQDIKYTVKHVVDGVEQTNDTKSYSKSVWVNDAQAKIEIAKDSLAQKKYTGYKFESINIDEGTTAVDRNTVIILNYVKDESQTQPTKYTVQHVVGGQVKDSQEYTGTAWINDNPAMIVVQEGTTAPNTYAGYNYTGISTNDPAVASGTVITLTYEPRSDIPYTVEYYYDGVQGKTPDNAPTGGTATLGDSVSITPDKNVTLGENHYVLTSTDHTIASIAPEGNVIKVYYELDGVVDPGKDPDPNVPGDEIPDKYQVTIVYQSADDAMGTVTGVTSKVVTLMDGNQHVEKAVITPDVEGVILTPVVGHKFIGWDSDPTLAITAQGGQTYTYTAQWALDQYPYVVEYYYDGVQGAAPEGAPAGDKADFGTSVSITPDKNVTLGENHYVLTSTDHTIASIAPEGNVIKVYYELDGVVDPGKDPDPNVPGDEIPDKYQVTIVYQSADDAMGTVTGVTSKVVTLMDGNQHVEKAVITPGVEGVILSVKDGHRFVRWDIDPNIEISAEGGNTYIYTAQWIQVHPVKFDVNGGEPATQPEDQEVDHGNTATEPADSPARPGYVFTGWTLGPEGNTPYVFSTPVTEPITLYAQWSPRTDIPYTVEYYYDDVQGDAPAGASTGGTATFGGSVSIIPDKNVTLGENHYVLTSSNHVIDPVGLVDNVIRVYYELDNVVDPGKDPDSNVPGDEIPDKYQVTIVYQSADPDQGTVTGTTSKVVTLVDEDGNNVMAATIYPGVDDVMLTPSEAYEVAGWDVDPTAGLYAEGGNTYSFTALWQPKHYPVDFDVNGGDPETQPEEQDVYHGDPATEPPAPSNPGYEFVGWTLDPEGNVPFDFNTPITGPVTLYAQWVPVVGPIFIPPTPVVIEPVGLAVVVAPIAEAIADTVNPLAAEPIDDPENPLFGLHAPECWTHWLMILAAFITITYLLGVLYARRSRVHDMDDFEDDVLNANKETKTSTVSASDAVYHTSI